MDDPLAALLAALAKLAAKSWKRAGERNHCVWSRVRPGSAGNGFTQTLITLDDDDDITLAFSSSAPGQISA